VAVGDWLELSAAIFPSKKIFGFVVLGQRGSSICGFIWNLIRIVSYGVKNFHKRGN
jgi:hypothetical protein